MEPQGADRSTSPSGSEDMESEDSDHEDNDQEKDQSHEDKDDSDSSSDSGENTESQANYDSDSPKAPSRNKIQNGEDRNSDFSMSPDKTPSGQEKLQNGERNQEGETLSGDSERFPMAELSMSPDKAHSGQGKRKNGQEKRGQEGEGDSEFLPMAYLPLEVITTVEPTNYAYPVLKNMSNGVLTHRNIFTEHERAVLKEIINKYRNIVDTRSRTREIYLEKQSVWQQIVEEYNSTENIMVRTEKELRKCWDNMKYRAKQAEKEVKLENYSAGAELELQALVQQAALQYLMREANGNMKVKMEPHEHEEHQPYGSGEDEEEVEGAAESAGTSGLVDEDREPALKKARQESPKLSSLLLAAASKRTPKKNSQKAGGSGLAYTLPSGNKAAHVKKEKKNANLAANTSSAADIPLLPKNLANCLSITNIPNPSIANHSGHNLAGRDSPGTSPIQHSLKPMPSLKKMVPGKHQSGKSSRVHKKANSLKSRNHGTNSTPSVNHNSSNSMNNMASGMNNLSPINHIEADRNDVNDRLLNTKLTNQRLELERREHEFKMKLMERELQAQTYQSQYWYLKVKLLQSGRENSTYLAGATNGDIE